MKFKKKKFYIKKINNKNYDNYIDHTLELIIISGIFYVVYNLLSPK